MANHLKIMNKRMVLLNPVIFKRVKFLEIPSKESRRL